MRCSAFAHRLSVVGLMAVLTVALGAPSPAVAAEIAVTPATFASAFASAGPGDALLLASGDYGEFRGAMKPGPERVTIKPQPGATARMAFRFNPASNITLEGLRITDGYVADSRTKNITIRDSSFDGARFVARGGEGDLVNANVLLDGNTHRNVDVCSGCYDGRVHIAERTEQPTGITVQNSLFEGGYADGIQNGGNGTRIIANTFRGLHQPDDGNVAHIDSIQLYGSKNTLIKGNFFYDVSVAVGAYDRVDHEVIEDNVVVLDGHNAWVSEFLSDEGSIWRHNTFASFNTSGSTSCAFGVPCGTIHTGHKEGDPPSKGTVFIDNILARIDGDRRDFDGGQGDYNLFTSRVGWGSHDRLGQPRYVGGDRPTTYEGFALAGGSPGKGTASEGTDRGARIGLQRPAPIALLPAKLQIERARVERRERRLNVLAPVTGLASGEAKVEFFAAAQRYRFTEEVDADHRRITFRRAIPAKQARLGTGIVTITYPGDADTRPQDVRLRAASQKADLQLGRPVIEDGRLKARGTISDRARGVVRLQLQYVVGGQTETLPLRGRIRDGRWKIDEALSPEALAGIAQRTGSVHSYTLFTGYFPRRIRGEMQSYQVLGDR